MGILRFIKDTAINIAGATVGVLEFVGLKYPVKGYRYKVSDALWRGSRLDAGAIGDLCNEGFRLIVNLCAENDNDNKPARLHGIRALHIPIIDNTPPKQQQMVDFLNAVIKPDNQPVYVHCEAGKGRTGVAVGCYRIVAEGWSGQDAVTEADKFGMGMPDQEKFLIAFALAWKRGEIFADEDGNLKIKCVV